MPRTAACFRYFGGMADKLQGDVIPVEPGFLNYVQREPLGVVGQIVPWNFPLMFCTWKMGPALAAGNTVVLKPSELTPLSLAAPRRADDRGRLPGRASSTSCRATAHAAGERLATHPDVAKIAFTGSTATGRRIVESSAGNLKRVQLELGGKGANIVFDDANIPAAVGRQRLRHLPQPGPGVHRRLAAAAARERSPTSSSNGSSALAQLDPARQPARPGHRDGPADLADAPRPRAVAT